MKKFINSPSKITKESIEGYALANKDLVLLKANNLIVSKELENADRVTIVTLGGSGHEPALSGFVGPGLIDISVVGEIFEAPGPNACIEAIKLANKGHGVLFIVLNHPGDMVTGDLTMKKVSELGLKVIKIVTQEDISNAPRSDSNNRRGLVGCIPAYKIAGAAAALGYDLERVAEITTRFVENMATLGVATHGATHPISGILMTDLKYNEMEIGVGQHGEGGGGRQKMKSADETAEIMLNCLLKDLSIKTGEKILLILNGVGATTLMELFIIYRKCANYLKEKNITICANYVGELLTVQEQAGFQMFIARMDNELLDLWNEPCNSAYFKKI